MAAEFETRPTDLVLIRLTLRGREGGGSVTVNESPTVEQLGLGEVGGAAEVPTLDTVRFAELMAAGGESAEEALRMQAKFIEDTAEYMAAGGTPPAESLAQAVVDWVVETRPDGHLYTQDPNADGYVISAREINVHGPIDLGGEERGFRVTAVGTWG